MWVGRSSPSLSFRLGIAKKGGGETLPVEDTSFRFGASTPRAMMTLGAQAILS